MLAGAIAQYGRGVGMIQTTAAQIIGQFAANLRKQLEQQPPSAQETASAEAPLPAAAKPIGGISLGARVLWEQLKKGSGEKS
jgi:type IV secretory pathway TrbL component